MKVIYNANVVTETEIRPGHAVVFDSKIIAVVPDSQVAEYPEAERINAKGSYLGPGFIDIHVHGCAGADTMDEDETALGVISRNLPRTGVTAFLPTTMTMPFAQVERTLQRVRTRMGNEPGAQILGCHLEGPFISREYKGAQDDSHLLGPNFSRIEEYTDVIRIVTVAPELTGSHDFIRMAAKRGLVVSIGHSAASYDQAMAAVEAGASHITHTFNALAAFNHREPGIIGALSDSAVTCELITDNVHVHPAAQRLLLRLKGPDKLILITDAMKACLMPAGEYDLGGQKVFVRDGAAHLTSGVIAGSVHTLNRAVGNFCQTSGLPLWQVVRMATLNPAKRLGIEARKGSIAPGKDADLVIFDATYAVGQTFVNGNSVYGR